MSTIPFLAISYTTPLSDDLKNTSFDSYEEATKAWEAFAFQQRFGALVRRLDKDRKGVYWQRELRCSLHGTVDRRYKNYLIDDSRARSRKTTKRNCQYHARAKLNRKTNKWELMTVHGRSRPLIFKSSILISLI
jgi:hypothetical protein